MLRVGGRCWKERSLMRVSARFWVLVNNGAVHWIGCEETADFIHILIFGIENILIWSVSISYMATYQKFRGKCLMTSLVDVGFFHHKWSICMNFLMSFLLPFRQNWDTIHRFNLFIYLKTFFQVIVIPYFNEPSCSCSQMFALFTCK